ncbi:MAG: UTP--glucose-1-phosphate uridylyltransferase, partial [Thermodesulfovibrionia bacterium]|nr:UTP--glucose-1-phosphate uridylyltransferase [Thermodesulfovibrionia bacterium]
MSTTLIETILSEDESIRNRSINSLLQGKNKDDLLKIADDTEEFRRNSNNLYHKVRASLYLFVIYRFFLMPHEKIKQHGTIPFAGVRASLERDFAKSIAIFLKEIKKNKLNSALFSAIAESYHKISFQYLLQQVKRSISQCNENFHLFNIKGLADYPYSVPSELSVADPKTGLYPILLDVSPVRLDPSHSGWSDIFFLGMDFPEGARVINLSVNLKIHGSDAPVKTPCECYCRFIQEPVIHLTSIDLNTSKKISNLEELFNFGSDHLSLLKAGVVASGIIPPCFEKKDISLKDILQKLLNKPGGIEVVTRVNSIPKGSRLAVSTALLATVITCLMRFSGQIVNLTGPLKDDERRVVASRAILGEWLGGSGGGWQDS